MHSKYQCEARRPGAASFTFPTPDEDCARATCDASGWELIRVWQPGSDADRPVTAPVKGDRPLSRAQVQALAIEAGKAYRTMHQHGLTDDTETVWRHAHVHDQVGRDGLSKCQNSHYKKLYNHFRRLQGESTVGGDTGGTAAQSGEGGDTLDRREQILLLLRRELGSHARRVSDPQTAREQTIAAHAAEHGGPVTEGYLLAIARMKNRATLLRDIDCLIKLTSARLEQIHITLRNRIAAREGRGKTQSRNKGQRKKEGGQ